MRNFKNLFAIVISALSFPLNAQTPVIFDTDMAIDDWAALLYTQMHPDLQLLAITVSASGETHCDAGVQNALNLVYLATPNTEIDVACGDPWPLDGYLVFPEAWQLDADTLSGIEIPASPATPWPGHAVELLHRTLMSASSPVILLVTGPMTNIAQWLEQYPEDKALVEKLVVMGGSYHAGGNIIVEGFSDGNPNLLAEWNFYIDPIAADQVLKSELPIELVSLDVTNHVKVSFEFAAEFKQKANNPAAFFWDKVLDNNDWFIESGEYYFWDVLAAITITDQERFCKGPKKSLSVAYRSTTTPWLPGSDLSMPSMLANGNERQHIDAATAGIVLDSEGQSEGGTNVLLCQETDAEGAFASYIEILTQ